LFIRLSKITQLTSEQIILSKDNLSLMHQNLQKRKQNKNKKQKCAGAHTRSGMRGNLLQWSINSWLCTYNTSNASEDLLSACSFVDTRPVFTASFESLIFSSASQLFDLLQPFVVLFSLALVSLRLSEESKLSKLGVDKEETMQFAFDAEEILLSMVSLFSSFSENFTVLSTFSGTSFFLTETRGNEFSLSIDISESWECDPPDLVVEFESHTASAILTSPSILLLSAFKFDREMYILQEENLWNFGSLTRSSSSSSDKSKL
jgi:hypothetical protein